MANPTMEEIRARAYQLWKDAGEPEGQTAAFWYQAEKELLQKQTDQANYHPV